MSGVIIGIVFIVVTGLFSLTEDHKTSKMSKDERWEYEWRKINKRK